MNISLLYSTTIKESEIIDLSIYPSIISRSSAQIENSRRSSSSSSSPTETPFTMSVDILDYSIRVGLFDTLILEWRDVIDVINVINVIESECRMQNAEFMSSFLKN